MNLTAITVDMILENLRPVLLFSIGGFITSIVLTPLYTSLAFKYRWWKVPRTDALSGEKASVFSKIHSEKHKRNIPTMAGMVVLIAIAVVTLLFNLDRAQTYLPLAAMIGAGLLGLIDDIINLRAKSPGKAGLHAGIKFSLMALIAGALAYWFVLKLGYSSIHIPFDGELVLAAPLMALAIIFVVVGTANAVNITDGLDGLAGGLLLTAYSAFGLIAFLQGNFGLSAFCFTVVGTLLSYLWFNIYPARFFMGDVGSFALGTGLAVVAIMTNTILLIPIVGVLFVVEVLSVIAQLISKKFFKRKIFLSAPIHHHFEAIGWPETKVTMRFWVLGQVAAVAGLLVAIWGGFVVL